MASSIRVFNQTRGYYMKRNQALKAVEVCACAWVDFGISVRDLTLAESITRRNAIAQMGPRIAYAELPGLTYMPTESAASTGKAGMKLSRVATYFARSITAPAT